MHPEWATCTLEMANLPVGGYSTEWNGESVNKQE